MFNNAPMTFELKEGRTPDTRIFRLAGPLTLRNMFEFQAALRIEPQPRTTVLDLTEVPYMDSAGMGLIVNFYVHCKGKGVNVVVAGVCDRVMELFRLTKVDTVIPFQATYNEEEFDG
jgi:anti-sigma B factor antagonist